MNSFLRLGVPIHLALVTCIAQATPAALVERSRDAMRVDPEISRRLAEQALERLAAQPDADTQVRAHLQLCDYYSERSREAALREIERARAVLSQAKRAGLRAGLLICEAELNQYAGDNVRAMVLLQRAVAVAETSRDEEMLAEALYQRGYLRGLQGELASGLADLRRAISTFEALGLPQQARSAINNVAILYNRMGDYANARQYFEASLEGQQAQGLTRELVVTQHNLGRVLENLKEWDAAQRAFETVLALSREIGYRRGEAYALRGLASVRNAHGAPADALTLLERAAQAQQGAPDERLRAQIMLQRGIALRGLRRIEQSLAELQGALQVFRQAESPAEIAATHGELARSLSAAGEWRAAFEQQVQFKEATDALMRRQLDQRYAALQVEFDTEARIKENALLKRENAAAERALEQERLAIQLQAIVLALLVLLAVVLASLLRRHRRIGRTMHALAMTDELTGLPNRRRVLAQLDALLADPDIGCALLIADVDHFKSINDQHGHLVGDEVLRAVAGALREAVREPTVLGRLGGEEFVFVVPAGDRAAAESLAQRLLARVRAIDVSHWLGNGKLSVSIGLAISERGDTAGQMLLRADSALYAAKASGRDRAVTHQVLDRETEFATVRP